MSVINTPTKKTLSSLFEKTKYSIPLYQRSYAWEETNWKELWEDISNQILTQDKEHFLGVLIYYPDTSIRASKFSNYQIIDGQQRLTSLIILMRVIYEKLKQDGGDFLSRTADELYVKYIGDIKDDTYHLVLSKKDKDFFRNYIQKVEPNRKNIGKLISNKNIRKCYDFYKNEIEKAYKISESETLGEFCFELKKKIESSIVFIAIDVLNEADAYLIFESINSKRQGLVLSDLLKNYFFSAAYSVEKEKPDSNKLEEAERLWDTIEQILDKVPVNQYIRHFWISKYGVSKGKVYEKELYSTIKSAFKTGEEIMALLESLEAEVSDYASILNATIPGVTDSGSNSLRQLQELRNKQYYPLILSALKAGLSKDDLSDLIGQIASTSIRRALLGKNPNDFETFFIENSPKIRNFEVEVKDIISSLTGRDFWIEDDVIRGELAIADFEDQDQLVKFFLKEFERFTVRSINEKIISKVSLEHLLPKNPENYSSWYPSWSGSEEDKRKHGELLWNIGNLTLIGPSYNREMSNKDFSEKKKTLVDSEIETTKVIGNETLWSETEIRNRNIEVQNFFIKRWNK